MRAKQRARIPNRNTYMRSASSFHLRLQETYLPDVSIETNWTESIFNDVFEDRGRLSIAVVEAEHVRQLLTKFNVTNFKDLKKLKSRVIVDLFAAGSGIMGHVKNILQTDFQEKCTLMSVDHQAMAKSIKGWQAKDIFDPKDWGGLLNANYICAPPSSGMSDAAFIFYAAECRDFCAFLLPKHWLADRSYPLRRLWWGQQQKKKTVYIIPSAKDLSWHVCVRYTRKGLDLFAGNGMKPHCSVLVESLYEDRKAKKTAGGNATSESDPLELALQDAVSQDGL
ncbi:hypothetical protein CYMTET_52843 [Cymbomonas tetramitiformis]|uniref:Uncharacterized protein n=1 Tax=Cymbomonas tetramitiformis TaxID=36881 RepID=A0AAE0BK13_9CHLO|nr:hypothetical protein CYMTET_52843 [Cymbomonas tetramitiformis]